MNPWRFSFGGTPAGFELPLFLLLAAVLALATVWLSRRAFLRPLAKGWVAPRLVGTLVPGRAPGREALKVALLGAGLSVLAVACARPYFGEVKQVAHRRGVDVVVALDASRSMLGEDVRPYRLAQARVAVESLMDQLHGDRIGLVAFAKDAFVQSPLTTDSSAARLYLRAVDPMQMQQGGTDVGGALREAGELLSRAKHGDRQQVVVLLTDGEDWGESASAQAKALGALGVKLFTVAVGTQAGAPVPELDERGRVVDSLRDANGAVVLSHANRAGLAALAQDAGGESFDLAGDLGVRSLARAIDGLKKSDLEEVTVTATAQRFAWFALPALGLLLLGLWLAPSRSRKPSLALAALLLFALPLQARADVFHVPEAAAANGAKAFAAGKYDEALKQFEAQKKQAEVARFNQGDALAALGRTGAALEAFKKASPELQGRDAYNRGTLQAKAGHREEASAGLREALTADAANEDARHNLEVVLAEQQKQKPKSGDSKQQQKPSNGEQPKDQQAKNGEQPKDQQAKNGEQPKDQQAKNGEQPKDQQAKNGEQPKDQQAKNGEQPKDQQQAGKEPPNQPGAPAQGEPREPTRAERMLDALKAGDRLLPYDPRQPPERSTPDAHPW